MKQFHKVDFALPFVSVSDSVAHEPKRNPSHRCVLSTSHPRATSAFLHSHEIRNPCRVRERSNFSSDRSPRVMGKAGDHVRVKVVSPTGSYALRDLQHGEIVR